MALPTGPYQGQDLTDYEAGSKFLPRQFYSLYPNTPSPSIANASTGITNTRSATQWPPQGYYPGAGDGGGGTGNKFGLNLDTQKDFKAGVWSTDMAAPGAPMTASYKPENRKIAQDQSGNWKFVDTNKNVYHANIDVETPGTMILDKMFGTNLKGKYGLSDEFTARKLGSTLGYELEDEEDLNIGTRRTIPQNIITRWKENREIKRAEAERVAADNAAAAKSRAESTRQYDPNVHGPNNYGLGSDGQQSYDTGQGFGAHATSGGPVSNKTGRGRQDYAPGGRIGLYAGGDPEEPAEDIHEIMRGENIPFSEQVEGEGDILSMLVAKYIEAGFPPDQAEEMAMQELQQMSAEPGQGEGIASLV